MFWLREIVNGRPTQEELDRYEEWARQKRAETFTQLFSTIGRGLVKVAGYGLKPAAAGLVAAYRALRRWQKKRAAIRELSGLSDYLLKDIGLHRGDIRPVVEGLLDGEPEAGTETRVFASRRQEQAPAAGGQETENKWQRAA